MTEAQISRFYFPAWNRCARAMSWKMVEGRLVGGRLPRYGGPEVDAAYQVVWNLAERFALQLHRAVTPEDLRHAVNFAASNRASTKAMNSAHANRAVALFDLLADPDNLSAMMRWSNPDLVERDGLLERIRQAAPEAYVRAISRDRFRVVVLDDLTTAQLKMLLFTLVNRRRAVPTPAQ